MASGAGSLFQAGISDISSAVGSYYSAKTDRAEAEAARFKAQGDLLEGQAYTKAAELAGLNATYTAFSTRIQQAQADRALYMTLGGQRAAAAASGGSGGGSAHDILASSAAQGALNRQVLGEQGLITKAGYQEQQASYNLMAQAAQVGAQGEEAAARGYEEAAKGADITAVIQGAAGVTMLAALA